MHHQGFDYPQLHIALALDKGCTVKDFDHVPPTAPCFWAMQHE